MWLRFSSRSRFRARVRNLAPVPLSIFRSNSKFDENSECSSFEYTRPITTIFCTRHDSDTVVTCAKYRCGRPRIFYTKECFEFSSNFEFDRNMLSGTGARLGLDLIAVPARALSRTNHINAAHLSNSSSWSLDSEWYSFNYYLYTIEQWALPALRTWVWCSYSYRSKSTQPTFSNMADL